jgi:phosphoribosylformylglycinamidine cyclo-ligase
MLPEGLRAEIREGSWDIPDIFTALEHYGDIPRSEMYNIFNMGIGFVLAVEENEAEDILQFFNEQGEDAFIVGRVTKGTGVHFVR